jgi:CMP-N,N'-diacetyllegionaminic acid synthase
MNILITICARGGSKGIPGKNVKLLKSKPLIGYSIEIAMEVAAVLGSRIALSTDDNNIKQVAELFQLKTEYQRPEFLSSDTAGKIDTINDLLKFEENKDKILYDYVLDLDVTSPLRTVDDVLKAFNLLREDREALTIFSVNPAERNPYFNMVEENKLGYYDLVKKSDDGSVMSRQKAPKVFELNASFYWYKRGFFNMGLNSPITHKSLVFEMDHICFDLDNPIDFDFMEYLLINNKIVL